MDTWNGKVEEWPKVRFGDVCEIVARQVDPKLDQYAKLPHISGVNIESGTGRLLFLNTAAEDKVTSNKYLFYSGDVLYSKLRPYLRKALAVDFQGVCSADMYPLRVDRDYLDPEFTAWLLISDSFTKYADGESRRARMPKLNREQLFNWTAQIPPLSKQKTINSYIKWQFDKYIRSRMAAKAQLEAAETLPAAYLRSIFQGPEAESWLILPLGEAGEISSGITLGRRVSDRETRPVPYLRVANVKDGHLDLSDVNEIDATEAEIEKLRLKSGDLLLTEGGDADKLGRGTFWEGQIPDCIHQNHIFRIRFDPSRFCHRFVAAQIASPYGKAYFLAHAKQTTGIATINQKVLSAFPLMVPPVREQKRIALMLDARRTEAERVHSALADRLKAIERLPASILSRAFIGAR
ncbi:restriction endonuclease subunit S [Tautonia plasticadhaerens]|uniref:restriction endonuclease subunit S n=1 Tax=Tautonia plasticadhaerens TaxID=2527974 RepID=UPI001E6220C6|nr:restriction endonuclease subunit S [Tautonia plasticadhaerens]